MSAPVTTTGQTFDDEFNALNASPGGVGGWMTQFPYGGEAARTEVANHEAEYYSDSSVGANPFSVSGGTLTITAAAGTNPDNLPFNSGLLTTYNSFSQEYGYFEMRAQLPAGDGLWPAFWLLPSNNSWPPEIDVMEMLGNDPTKIYVSTHAGTSSAEVSNTQAVTVANTSTGFHTYGVDWEPSTITFYFDGKAIASAPTPSDMHQPMYMLLNLAVGATGSWPGATDGSTPLPAHMLLDYVHAYATAATVDVSSTFTAGVAASTGTTSTGTTSTGTSGTSTSSTGTTSGATGTASGTGTTSSGTTASSSGTGSVGTTSSATSAGTAGGSGTPSSGTANGAGINGAGAASSIGGSTVAGGTSGIITPTGSTTGASSAMGGTATTSGATASSGWVVTAAGGISNVTLADGGTAVTFGSDDVQLLGSGVVYAAGPAVTVQGGGGRLLFVGGAGAASVNGGAGSVLAYAGSGGGSLVGGAAGGNILVAAGGNTTLQGAGSGDVLFGPATASGAVLAAGAGAEVMVAGAGATTLTGGTGSTTLFLGGGAGQQVVAGAAGSSEAVVGFRTGVDALSLGGASVTGSVSGAWGTTLVLSDGARVTMFGMG